MDIRADTITVVPATHTPDGKPLEPEQAPAVRSISVISPLAMNNGTLVRPDMPGSFDYETTAGELAVGMRFKCASCIHFNPKRWQKLKHECEWSSDVTERKWLNEVRSSIEQVLPAGEREKHVDEQTGELDIEHALMSLGLCDALTEEWSRLMNEKWPVLVHQLSGCPDVDPLGQPQAPPFRSRDTAADRAAAKAYDGILGMAQGKAFPKP